MEAGQPPDVLLLHAAKGRDRTDIHRQQLWLARISGRDGQILWQQPLSEPNDLDLLDAGFRLPRRIWTATALTTSSFGFHLRRPRAR